MAASSDEKPDVFHADMKKANVGALWERYTRHDDDAPRSEPAFQWPWAEVEPLIDQAVRETGMDTAERRVIQMKNPAFPADAVCATNNINCGFQILMPGERARPHRHTMNALRFVVEDGGGVVETIVDGKHCPMSPGDMIVTPAWTWHEHLHDGTSRVIWLDALDVPIVDHLGAAFFEPGGGNDYPDMLPDSAFTSAGFAPGRVPAGGHSPLFHYSWEASVEALQGMKQAKDGSRQVRYINPATGGPIMSLLDCYLLGLDRSRETAPYRTSSNAACFVAEGDGVSTVGDTTINWGKNDVFSLPHWQWVAHKASSATAKLFVMTDREVYRRLELLWDEGDGAGGFH
ncbi:MAG: cupin domain-containing protein [Pseudomonadota bacterium]|nr:cupin domain-containing protein [Pseudomonadota bacterium]